MKQDHPILFPALSRRRPIRARSFWVAQRGSIAMQFAMVLPLLLLVVGGTIDFLMAFNQKTSLQNSVDAATLAAATELSLSDARRENVAAVVEAAISRMMGANTGNQPLPIITTAVRTEPLEVAVQATQAVDLIFGNSFGLISNQISAKSVARVVGRPNVCVLALEASESQAIDLKNTARMTGNDCGVFSNSSSTRSIAVRSDARLSASTVCAAGGVDMAGIIDPPPLMDCPQFEDPLASRVGPMVGTCTHNGLIVNNEVRTLTPGVYCGGLTISGNSLVTFESGDYVIKDGPFQASDLASITGSYVSFYLATGAYLNFGKKTALSLSANRTGPMAGLLFFGARSQSQLLEHTILSENAQNLVGTIYLPQNSLRIDGDAAVGGDSAYTAIVARRVVLMNGPHLVLNSNYEQTDVPVPEGIKGAGQPVQLVE